MLNEQCSKFVIRLFTFGAEYRRFRTVFCSSSLFFTLAYEVWVRSKGVSSNRVDLEVWRRIRLNSSESYAVCSCLSENGHRVASYGQQVMSSEAVLNYRVHNCQWTAMPAQIAVICWNHPRKSTERPLKIQSEIPTNFRVARRIVRVNELARA